MVSSGWARGIPVLSVCVAFMCSACSETDSTTDVFFTVGEGFVPQVHSLRVQSIAPTTTDAGPSFDETRSLAEVSGPLGARLVGEPNARWSIAATAFSLRQRFLGEQRAQGLFDSDGKYLSSTTQFDPSCASVQCNASESCELGVCVALCSPPDPCPTSPPTVYVDAANGTNATPADGGRGCTDPSTPCADIQFALQEYGRTHQVFEVHGGGGTTRYAGFSVAPEWSGSEAQPRLIRGWPGTGRPIIEGDGEAAVRIGQDSDRTAHVVIAGFEMTESPRAVEVRNAENVRLRNLVIRALRVADSAIEVVDASQIEILDIQLFQNTAASTGFSGIHAAGDSFLIARNVVVGASGWQIDVAGDNHTVRDNLVLGGESGIRIDGGSGATVSNNRICETETDAVLLRNASNWSVEFNTIFAAENGVQLLSNSGGRLQNNLVIDQRGVGFLGDGSGAPDNRNNLVVGSALTDRMGITSSDPASELASRPTLIPELTGESCANAGLPGDEPASVAATDAGPIGAEAIRIAPIASASPDTPEQTISVEAEDLE
ncbi:MAG: right-handed parallel beta-helix repeat-containing protein, partial [Myxococcota bacterium]